MKWTKTLLAASIAAAVSSASYADDLKINGFISIQANMMADDEASEPGTSFAGADDELKFKNGSLLGLQVSKRVNDKVSITGQLVSRGADDFDTDATWAYVTYDLSDETKIRAGKFRTPFFKYSDFLEVGYAYHWTRPPVDVYSFIPFSSVEGIDLTHSFSIGDDIEASVQAYFGNYDGELDALKNSTSTVLAPGTPAVTLTVATGGLDVESLKGVVFNADWQSFNFRTSYHSADLTSRDALYSEAASFGPLAADFSIKDKESTFFELAVGYDDGTNRAVIEHTQLEHETAFFVDHTATLVSYARRMGDFQPHVTYSMAEYDFRSGAVGATQKAGVQTDKEFTSITLGVRYDLASSTALKFDIQNRERENHAGQTRDNTLYTIALDIVF